VEFTNYVEHSRFNSSTQKVETHNYDGEYYAVSGDFMFFLELTCLCLYSYTEPCNSM